MMERSCVFCGSGFQARSSRALYCSDRCRKRRQRTGRPVAEVVQLRQAQGDPADHPLVAAVRDQLVTAGRLDTYLGAQSLLLARRMAASDLDGASGVAALSQELDRLMTAALRDVEPDRDELDQIHDNVRQLRSGPRNRASPRSSRGRNV